MMQPKSTDSSGFAHVLHAEWTIFRKVRLLVVGMVVAVAAVFALALGAVFRRRIIAVIAGLALTVVPFILAYANLVPEAVSQWLRRLTPDAGFAVQQPLAGERLLHVSVGYYPLAPWAGFAVLCGYTVLALGLAIFVPRRRGT